MKNLIVALAFTIPVIAQGAEIKTDYLIKFKPGKLMMTNSLAALTSNGGSVEASDSQWVHVQITPTQAMATNSEDVISALQQNPDIEYVQPDYALGLIENYKSEDPQVIQAVKDFMSGQGVGEFGVGDLFKSLHKSRPEIPGKTLALVGDDPLLDHQWGMKSIHATDAWKQFQGSEKMVVAVIDTGVDYTHEDLVENLWHNPREIPNNHIDDDGNGFVDDVIGWDFIQNDNKPFDVATGPIGVVLTGGNPGHGTHCAGNIGARGSNTKGISGVSPHVSIMALRFLDQKGHGSTAQAVKAINYAVQNGAKIISSSWGSEGEDPKENNQALKDAITNAMKHNVLFISAAGNGRHGAGYDNDTDAKPSYPASYNIPNIISVAAIDSNDQLGKFSNWGAHTVHVAAPGVGIFSTTVGNHYSDSVVNFAGIVKASWSGTSMATPHVSGAAAMVWAAHPEMNFMDVKNRLMSTVDKVPALNGKVASGGKINVARAIQ